METHGTMKNVLFCIASHFVWLFEVYSFKLTNSEFDESFGGAGWVELTNQSLRIRFVSDRENVHVELAPLEGWNEGEGVTVDLIYGHLTGQDTNTARVTEETTSFLKGRFEDIALLFSKNEPLELRSIFKELKKQRARRLFG